MAQRYRKNKIKIDEATHEVGRVQVAEARHTGGVATPIHDGVRIHNAAVSLDRARTTKWLHLIKIFSSAAAATESFKASCMHTLTRSRA